MPFHMEMNRQDQNFSSLVKSWRFLLVAVLLFISPIVAQEVKTPSQHWYKAFLLVKAGEELEENGKLLEALNKYSEAEPIYDFLAQQFPQFEPDLVRERRSLIDQKRGELKAAMTPQAPQSYQPSGLPNPNAAPPAATSIPSPNFQQPAAGTFTPSFQGGGSQTQGYAPQMSGGIELPSWAPTNHIF